MWTKLLNTLGIETQAQKDEAERAKLEVLRQARAAQARRRAAQNVITTDDVKKKGPSKTSSKVKAERYGYSDTDPFPYEPTVFLPALHVPVPFPESVSPSYEISDSRTDSSDYSDYGRHHAPDPAPAYSGSYDAPARDSYSYDPPASSSYDSGSSYSSSDSGSSGGSFGE